MPPKKVLIKCLSLGIQNKKIQNKVTQNKMENNKKALIAMSGGVDSSVAALLTRDMGYECIGATMKLHNESTSDEPEPDFNNGKKCCTVSDAEDARSVCYRLGFKFYVFDYMEEFKKNVIEKFVSSYEIGETPNPCIDCNRFLKFGKLYQKALELGCEYVVTGHYARVEFDEKSGRYLLKKSKNPAKDQSYVLYFLSQEQLAHTRFPLGVFSDKSEVRALAERYGFVNSDKAESQDICFVPNGDYAEFIQGFTKKNYPEGDFLLTSGEKLGRHKGVIRYTVGQRKGLGISYSEPLYVCGKSASENTVTLGTQRELYRDSFTVRDFNWISIPDPEPNSDPIHASVRTRYHGAEAPVTVTVNPDRTVLIRFDEPQKAISPGQSAVLYDGDTVIGGGIIIG